VSKYLWLYKSRFYKVIIDGKDYSGTYFLINIANGQQFGYDFKIAPDAHLQDGLLDAVLIKPFPKVYGIVLAWHAYRGTILQSRYVQRVRAKEILISNDQLKLAHLDGDSLECEQEVVFKVHPNALSIIQNNASL
jgi:diacylglycerol kinase family enzyme